MARPLNLVKHARIVNTWRYKHNPPKYVFRSRSIVQNHPEYQRNPYQFFRKYCG